MKLIKDKTPLVNYLVIASFLTLILSGLFAYGKIKGTFSDKVLGYEPVDGIYVFDGINGTQSTIVIANQYEDAQRPDRYVVALDYGADVNKNSSVLEVRSSTLLINSIDTLVLGSLKLTGGSIAMADGGSIVLGKPVWFKDYDQDGLPSDLKVYVGAMPVPNDVNKNIRMYNGAINNLVADCSDTNPTLNVTVNGYLDLDGDGYGEGSMVVCATSTTGYVANNKDCNDNNAQIKSVSAIGGTITSIGSEVTHTFLAGRTNTYTFNLVCPTNLNAQVLLVGGGGGAGWENTDSTRGGGAGGAGGLVYIPSYGLTAGAYSVTIGLSGSAGTSTTDKGDNGGNSIFGSLTALGGGGAGSRDTGYRDGNNGGSGGGAGRNDSNYGAGGQGGGGGAGGAASGATGGIGMSVFGATYAAGGNWNSNGSAGTASTGNGGNACNITGSNCQLGGAGGSGIVIVKYLLP